MLTQMAPIVLLSRADYLAAFEKDQLGAMALCGNN